MFVEVLLVPMIIHKLLGEREKRTRLDKLNMVIGSFFSEVGTKLPTYFSDLNPNLDSIRKELIVKEDWSDDEFARVNTRLRNYQYDVKIHEIVLEHLTNFLVEKREFMLYLLQNPTVMEHETFTDLLRAVFHMTDELDARGNVAQHSEKDYEHIAFDLQRAYILLVNQWLDYMKHLKDNYPYYYSFAMRTNPFDQTASPFIK